MKIKFIFFIVSILIFLLSIITICCAPIINKIFDDFENWKSNNCDAYSDFLDSNEIELKDYENYRYIKNLCRRQKSMYNLEYISLIFNTSLSFLCSCLSILLLSEYFKHLKRKIGLFGFISGIICFILTLIYVCFSGYIFTNDVAYGRIEKDSFIKTNSIKKLFPNGATYKWNNNKYITAFEGNTDDYSYFIKYKDLGDKIYNYDKELQKRFTSEDPCILSSGSSRPNYYIASCKYIFEEQNFNPSNKYLYDRWISTLILSCFIFLFNICQTLFGFLLFKDEKDDSKSFVNNLPKEAVINEKRENDEILNIKVNKKISDNNKNNMNEQMNEEDIKSNTIIKADAKKDENNIYNIYKKH
jgi:hypothetical protein